MMGVLGRKATLLVWSAEEKLTREGGSRGASQVQPQSGEFSGCESVLPFEFSSIKRMKILGSKKSQTPSPATASGNQRDQ